MFDAGIKENDIDIIKALNDILLYYASASNMEKLNKKQEVINDFFSYSNSRLEEEEEEKV